VIKVADIMISKKVKNTKSIKKTNKNINIIVMLFIILLGILVVFPIFWMIRTSFMSNLEINQYPPSFLPKKWMFSNFTDALTTFTFGRYLMNTLTIVLLSIVGVIITASTAAYAFARLDFPLKNLWFSLIIGSMLMPAAVTLIPIFITWSKLGFYNSYVPLIVPAYLGGGAFNIFLIRQFMLTIPKDIDEAAIIDGASHMQILFGILMPMVKPVLISVGLFTFINLWNDLLGPVIYISDQERNTIAQGLATFKGGFGTNWRVLMAASCMSTLPAVGLYVVGQKYFIEGIVLTGLKS
jgi:multiple sugar transport system permease protein